VPIYDRYAEIYDATGQDEFGKRMLRDVEALLSETKLQPSRVLDLACGTGTVATLLAQQGLVVYGADASAKMLEVAERKAKSLHLPVTFVQQDMRCLDLGTTFDLVTCFYDAINYILNESDLLTVFAGVYRHLNTQGLFVFDANTVSALRDIWGNNSFADDYGDVAYIWDNDYDAATGLATLTATFFVRQPELGDSIYEKFVEVHIERGYPIRQVISMLEEVGFKVLKHYAYGRMRPATEEDRRVVFVAQKP
jgi:SAM-dependent methyltransferase